MYICLSVILSSSIFYVQAKPIRTKAITLPINTLNFAAVAVITM